MEIVVTSAEMRACDRYAIEKLKIPGLILMENAGRGVVEMMIKHYGSVDGKSVLIFSGKGNNGGDGFVAARHLYNHGAKVQVVLAGNASDLRGDAKTNYESIRRIAKEDSSQNSFHIIELKSNKHLNVLPEPDFIIDALFGTGFVGDVKGIHKHVIEWINNSIGTKISIDIPSGVNADTGEVRNVAVKSNLTVTMGLMKCGLMVGQGRTYSGLVEVADISVPKFLPGNISKSLSQTFVVHAIDVKQALPIRPFDAHKHSVGKIFVLGGSKGLTGAAAMTSEAAMRSGAGAVVLGTPASVYPILARKLTEVMVEPLPESSEGSLGAAPYKQIEKHCQWADVVIIGPGLSRNPETAELVHQIVSKLDKPLLIDADAINAFEERPIALKQHKSKNVIITPHTGELSRLTGISPEEIELDRISVARRTAKQFKLTVVLKGAPTITASENGDVFINSTGNPGMATAGSGDILSGVIGALWGQGMDRITSAYSGVFVHGLAGDLAKKEYGEKSMVASDIGYSLPKSLHEIEGITVL